MVVRNGCMNPASVQPDPGGKLRPAWPADSTVTARFSACQRYGQPPAPLRQRGQAVELLLKGGIIGSQTTMPGIGRTDVYLHFLAKSVMITHIIVLSGKLRSVKTKDEIDDCSNTAISYRNGIS